MNAPKKNKSRGISPRHLEVAETATKFCISDYCWFFKTTAAAFCTSSMKRHFAPR